MEASDEPLGFRRTWGWTTSSDSRASRVMTTNPAPTCQGQGSSFSAVYKIPICSNAGKNVGGSGFRMELTTNPLLVVNGGLSI